MSAPQRPTFGQALLITVAGALFAFFSCLGALVSGLNSNGTTTTLVEVGLVGFVLGLLVLLVGIGLVIWVAVRPFLRKGEPVQPAEPKEPGT